MVISLSSTDLRFAKMGVIGNGLQVAHSAMGMESFCSINAASHFDVVGT